MRTGMVSRMLCAAAFAVLCSAGISHGAPVSTAFTYQGRLLDANDVADGLYDFQFRLYDSDSGGNQVGLDVTIPDIDVIDGYFTAELDFGGVFDSNAIWLEIGVRAGELGDPNTYTVLEPRQKVTAAPYALYAASSPGLSVPVELSGSTAEPTALISVTNAGGGRGVTGKHQTSGNYGYLGGVQAGVYGESPNNDNYGMLGGVYGGAFGYGFGTVPGVQGRSEGGYGVSGYSANGYGGVYGSSESSYGVEGWSFTGWGILGKTSNYGGQGGVAGVVKRNDGSVALIPNSGVMGSNQEGYGVAGTTIEGIGVYGVQENSGNFGYLGTTAYGVYGHGSGNCMGVTGVSINGLGVYGSSTSNHGVRGTTYGAAGYGVYGNNMSNGNYGYLGSGSYGAYGIHDDSGNYGYLGGSDYGVYGYGNANDIGVYGISVNATGVYGITTNGIGVYGKNEPSGNVGYLGGANYAVYGYSNSGFGVYGSSSSGYAGYFSGNVYSTGNVSAASFTDRTPYPKDLATAYDAVMSMERLPDGRYQENDRENQLDHSRLSTFIRSADGNRDLSAAVSCLNEVVKDLAKKVESQQQLIETQNRQIQQLTEMLQTTNRQKSLSLQEQ